MQGFGPIDMSTWGAPSAAYMGTGCNVAEFFSPQKLVFDITLCAFDACERTRLHLT
jgi:hypothetical protein